MYKTIAWKEITPKGEKLINLYTKISEFNIEKGIQTLKLIKEEGSLLMLVDVLVTKLPAEYI
jgi:hypothetical protein